MSDSSQFTYYRIDVEKCIGCHKCFKVCPAGAVVGNPKEKHAIIEAKCIACGACFDGCKLKAIIGMPEDAVVPASTGDAVMSAKPECILCGMCVDTCDKVGVKALSGTNPDFGSKIPPVLTKLPVNCVGCLACANVCPTKYIPSEAGSGYRKIWGHTFKQVKCTVCGHSTITSEQFAFYAGKNGVSGKYFELCDECKRKRQVELTVKLMGGSTQVR